LDIRAGAAAGGKDVKVDDDSDTDTDSEADNEKDEVEDEEDSEEEDEESGDAAVEEEDDDESEEEEDESEEEEDAVSDTVQTTDASVQEQTFDEPLFPSAFANIYVTFGVMLLAKKLDLKSHKAAIIARISYISYIVILQLFLAYARIKAKAANDRTTITVNNPMSSALQGQMEGLTGGGGAGAGVMKMLASSLLSSATSVLEYDLKEVKNMQRGLLFNMAFQWFLHFKMKQVQPLLIQTGSGLLNLYYSPLFQVYVLGKRLERPFKVNTNTMAQLQEMQAQAAAGTAGGVTDESTTTTKETVKKITDEVEPEVKGAYKEEEDDDDDELEVMDEDDDEEEEEGADEDDETAEDEDSDDDSDEDNDDGKK